MRSSLLIALAALALGCSTRGTAPDSIEVGQSCASGGSIDPCEEICVTNLDLCTFVCNSSADCPLGSACIEVKLTASNQNICLPMCYWGGGCGSYAQGFCCASVKRAEVAANVEVCMGVKAFPQYTCITPSPGPDAGVNAPTHVSCRAGAECADYEIQPGKSLTCPTGTTANAEWCPPASRVGSCAVVIGDGVTRRKRYYSGTWTAPNAQQDCIKQGGMWTAG